MAEIKPDVIHLHSSKAGAIGRVAFNGKIPMFYTPHGYSFLMENYKPMKRRMFNQIAESLPDVKFVWIGDGELREQLTSKNIEITGWADRSTAIRYAVNADVFLLPSRWEGLPISLLESMYMKKVCVVSNVIGNRDVIHNEENGFVCTKVEDFVKAIKECQSEDGKLVERAYQDILKMYNTKVMAEQYSRKYEMATNKLGGGTA